MNDLKYVIINEKDSEVPIVFSFLIPHDKYFPVHRVVSAGFCRIRVGEETGELTVYCFGKSVLLNKSSRGEVDETMILKTLKGR
jgi:hypothetical protein